MKIKNPVGIKNIGDPFILKENNKYYLYATSFAKNKEGSLDGFKCFISDDLVNWKELGFAYKKNDLSFGYKDFWAPEVIKHNNKYIMHYSARQKETDSLRIGVAISDNPEGPFIDYYPNKPMFDFGYAVIDGHVYIDEDGKNYFYYDKDCSENFYNNRNESHIYACLLDDTLTKVISEPKLILKPDQSWELVTGDWAWNEGPYVLKKDNLYYMLYSAGFYASKSYAIGYATANNPMGPFTKASENPIVKSVEGLISGPGHNSVFKNNSGELLTAYHVHNDINNPSEKRQLFIDKLEFVNKKIVIKATLNGEVIK